MKLSDKGYKKISRIISSETIYSPSRIYEELAFLQYDVKRLLYCIEISMITNICLSGITCFSKKDMSRKLKELNIKEV